MLKLFFLLSLFLFSCSGTLNKVGSFPVQEEKKVFKKKERGTWWIDPDIVRLGKYTKFEICGDRDLRNVILYVDESVDYFLDDVMNDGKCAIFSMTIEALKRNSSEVLGRRKIDVSVPTLDTMVVLYLKVKNDIQEE